MVVRGLKTVGYLLAETLVAMVDILGEHRHGNNLKEEVDHGNV